MTLLMRDNEMIKKGREEGIILGKNQGKIETIFSFVQDGIIPLEVGADKANLSIETFKEEMAKAGYKLPTSVQTK